MIALSSFPWATAGQEGFVTCPSFARRSVRRRSRSRRAVVAVEIDAAPDADLVGEGEATLRIRNGTALTDGDDVTVYSDFLGGRDHPWARGLSWPRTAGGACSSRWTDPS